MLAVSVLILLVLSFCECSEIWRHRMVVKPSMGKNIIFPRKKIFEKHGKFRPLICAKTCLQHKECSFFILRNQECRGYGNSGGIEIFSEISGIIHGNFEMYSRKDASCPHHNGFIHKGVCFNVTSSKQTFSGLIDICIRSFARPAIINPKEMWRHATLFENGTSEVAQARPTQQDSTYIFQGSRDGSLSSLAVDGVDDSDWGHWHCSSTDDNDNSIHWWQVDTGQNHMISRVDILPRSDGPENDLRNFIINVFQQDPVTTSSVKGSVCVHYKGRHLMNGRWSQLKCLQPILGRFVRITKRHGFQGLTLCEVKVWTAEGQNYVGASNLNPEGAWRWNDGSDVTGPWNPGQPSGEATAHCLTMTEKGLIQTDCDEMFPGVCEVSLL